MRNILLVVFALMSFCVSGQVRLDTTVTVWNKNNYAAFTSLVHVDDYFYCAFREAKAHRPSPEDKNTWGRIVVLKSKDAKKWTTFAKIKEKRADLRDPKLSVTPDRSRLCLMYCKRAIVDGKVDVPTTKVTMFSGKSFSKKQTYDIEIANYKERFQWLWGITWKDSVAYGFMYGKDFVLLKSNDGIHYTVVTKMLLDGKPGTEAHIAFDGNTAYTVARGNDDEGFLGSSVYPFTTWNWNKLGMKVGGPHLFITSGGGLILGTRNYMESGRTSLYDLKSSQPKKLLTLPSQSDSSYPSIIEDNGKIYVSFYSRNKEVGKTNIYLSVLDSE